MIKIVLVGLLAIGLNAVSFPIDAYDCERAANKLKSTASELADAESRVNSAESDYESNCGPYGYSRNDEYSCGTYGSYKSEYEDAISNYNSLLSDIHYNLKITLRSCQ